VDQQFRELNDMFADFRSMLLVKQRQLEAAVSSASNEVMAQVDWWEAADIFGLGRLSYAD
jgi:hypothetical protein